MTYKQKLFNLLCEVEEIKKDLLELRLWTKVKLDNSWRIGIFINEFDVKNVDYEENMNVLYKDKIELSNEWWLTYNRRIGNQIHIHHLLWFCEKNNFSFLIRGRGIIIRIKWDTKKLVSVYLNNKKPLDEQTEEVFEKIYNFLKKYK